MSREDEGLVIGSSAQGMLLVLSEAYEVNIMYIHVRMEMFVIVCIHARVYKFI
jgi:hypothetical protein